MFLLPAVCGIKLNFFNEAKSTGLCLSMRPCLLSSTSHCVLANFYSYYTLETHTLCWSSDPSLHVQCKDKLQYHVVWHSLSLLSHKKNSYTHGSDSLASLLKANMPGRIPGCPFSQFPGCCCVYPFSKFFRETLLISEVLL